MRLKSIGVFLGIFATNILIASDFQSPRTASLGGAGHAGPLLNDAIYLNPSYSSLLGTYSIAVNYEPYSGGVQNADGASQIQGHEMNFSIQDGRSELFQAGVGYTTREDTRLVHLGASKAVMKELGVGLGAKFEFPKDGSGRRLQDMMLSSCYLVNPWLQTAIIVDNLFETAARSARGDLREIIVGSKFNVMDIMLVYFDPHLVPNAPVGQSTFGTEAGVEFPLMADLFLRLGMFRNSFIPYEDMRGHGYAFGLGWLAPRVSFDYALQRATFPIGATSHNFGITIYF